MNKQRQNSVGQIAQTSQIITFALIIGVVTFLVFALVTCDKNAQPAEQPIISYVAVVATAMALITRMILKQILAKGARSNLLRQEELPEEAYHELLGPTFMTVTIIGAALPEGAAFISIIAFMIEHHWWVLLLLVPLLGTMILAVPTKTKVENWIKTQLEEMSLERN